MSVVIAPLFGWLWRWSGVDLISSPLLAGRGEQSCVSTVRLPDASARNGVPCVVRIATDISIQHANLPVVPFLQPFYPERANFEEDSAWGRRFAAWTEVAHDQVEVTAVDEADVVVIPVDWFWVRGALWSSRTDNELALRCRALNDRARAAGKPVIVFFTGDRSCDRVGLPGAHVFREGPYRSRMTSRDHVMPAFAEDLVMASAGQLVTRAYQQPPVIGFCGMAREHRGWKQATKRLVSQLVIGARQRWIEPPPQVGEQLRARALASISAHPGVMTNVRLRAGSVFLNEFSDRDKRAAVRNEYVTNLAESDYVLCVRGSGNFSFRLYEALCMGRTPVIVDTDIDLPSPARIDWSSIAVTVAQPDLDRIADAVAEFHTNLPADKYEQRQGELRQVWLDELSPQGFFGGIAKNKIPVRHTR